MERLLFRQFNGGVEFLVEGGGDLRFVILGK
jgi:hypothetical protein